MKKYLTILLCMLAVSSPAWADNRMVPDQYPTIQEAINDSADGDVVIIQPGIYQGFGNTNLDTLGKAITLRSTAPTDPEVVAQTIINCTDMESGNLIGRGFITITGETPATYIQGLTIQNGAEMEGGAIYCINSSPAIEYCVFKNNNGYVTGGAVYAGPWSSPVLNYCTFIENTSMSGGAIAVKDGSATLNSCVLVGNSGMYGAGVYFFGMGDLVVQNCTFADNAASVLASGIYCEGENLSAVSNSIFWNNMSLEGAMQDCAIYLAGQGSAGAAYISYCDMQDLDTAIATDAASTATVGDGMISVDPLFVADSSVDDEGYFVPGDYHLQETSPCINAGDPEFVMFEGETDMDGEMRIMGQAVEIGADEIQALIEGYMCIVPHKLYVDFGKRYLLAYVRLEDPELDIRTTVPDSILLNGTAVPVRTHEFRCRTMGLVFRHDDIEQLIGEGDEEITLTVTGQLENEMEWQCQKTLKIVYREDIRHWFHKWHKWKWRHHHWRRH
jgi:predicted outer membrane repeat protein